MQAQGGSDIATSMLLWRGHEVPRVVIRCARSGAWVRVRSGRCAGSQQSWRRPPPRASAVGEGCQDSSRLTLCPAGDDLSPRSPNRRTRSSNLPGCCGNPRSVNGLHRITIDSSDNGHAMRPTAQPLTASRWMRLAASLKTRSERHTRRVEQGQVSPPPTKRGVKPRPGSSSWRLARRRTGRVKTPLTHRGPTAAPTLRRRRLGRPPRKQLSLTIDTTMPLWAAHV